MDMGILADQRFSTVIGSVYSMLLPYELGETTSVSHVFELLFFLRKTPQN